MIIDRKIKEKNIYYRIQCIECVIDRIEPWLTFSPSYIDFGPFKEVKQNLVGKSLVGLENKSLTLHSAKIELKCLVWSKVLLGKTISLQFKGCL